MKKVQKKRELTVKGKELDQKNPQDIYGTILPPGGQNWKQQTKISKEVTSLLNVEDFVKVS